MTLKYLITGATGGLGKEVLAHFVANVPKSDFAVGSSNEANRSSFEDQGIAFRHVNFDEPRSLETAFKDVDNLFFVSTNTFDNARRMIQHQSVVDAAKKTEVKHVWYTSLAFGGLKSDSKVAVQTVHYQTETMLEESGINYTSIREGVYADAFPLFLNWYPDTETLYLPANATMALATRKELGEANARLMLAGGHDKEIVLLTAPEPASFAAIVDEINSVTGRSVKLEIVSPEDYIKFNGANDQGGKPLAFFQMLASWYEGLAKGDAQTTHPLMTQVLGRTPTTPLQAIRGFLISNPDYTWHQNYIHPKESDPQ
ncbi:NmrA-like family protein [Hesseltinella vesiculosa]|uniref:NmrA-like family protein n=1 Tax=Hesseltinella vesiculosa TaxID=101127 RepID=A0A1X2GKL9_9FUNG|nr:NmrA-like family protein [Hesseltinella vesiculosa]